MCEFSFFFLVLFTSVFHAHLQVDDDYFLQPWKSFALFFLSNRLWPVLEHLSNEKRAPGCLGFMSGVKYNPQLLMGIIS